MLGKDGCAYRSSSDDIALCREYGTNSQPVVVKDIGPGVKLLLVELAFPLQVPFQVLLGLMVVGCLPYHLQRLCLYPRRERARQHIAVGVPERRPEIGKDEVHFEAQAVGFEVDGENADEMEIEEKVKVGRNMSIHVKYLTVSLVNHRSKQGALSKPWS